MRALGGWLRARAKASAAGLRPLGRAHNDYLQDKLKIAVIHSSSRMQQQNWNNFQSSDNFSIVDNWENLLLLRCLPNIPVFSTNQQQNVKDYTQNLANFSIKNENCAQGQLCPVKYPFIRNYSEVANDKFSNDGNKGASEEQLEYIFQKLSKLLPELFFAQHDYTIYHPDIVFINNIRGTKSTGLMAYVKQVALLRTIGHLKFGYIIFEIIKITKRQEDSSVIVRWRIRGIGGMKALFLFWKIKIWKLRENITEKETWYDGLSTFYVGNDGKIFKHIADKMMPDEENVTDPILPKGAAVPVS